MYTDAVWINREQQSMDHKKQSYFNVEGGKK